MSAKRDEPFEELYRRLEQTVEKLEKGGLSLEESIELYEQGMDLAKRCQSILDVAELRITKLRESFAQPAEIAATEEPVEEEALLDEE
ncbi:MAG: exodeoxyribonuclease VII small subunit [Dehalococcoidia bacterium]